MGQQIGCQGYQQAHDDESGYNKHDVLRKLPVEAKLVAGEPLTDQAPEAVMLG